MHAIHLSDLHVRTSPNWFLVSVGGIVAFGICLFTFAISFLGGEEFIDSLGGYVTLTILILGLIVSVVASIATHPDEGLDLFSRS
jgi:hypothetical protein